MTTEEALLAAVWASPHDDLPRLVYADWLDETGDPAKAARAEFIRVQCELARLDDQTCGRWHTLKGIETRLWERHRGLFRRGVDCKLVNEPFHRGFVAPHRRMIVLDHFLNWPDEKVNRAPLWEFNLNNFAPPMRLLELTQNARLQRLGFLGVWNMTDEQVVAVADSPHAVNLAGLHCRRGVLTAVGVRAIAQSPNLPHLTELLLDTDWVDVPLAHELVNSSLAEQLKRLDLMGCSYLDPVAYAMLSAKYSRRLVVGNRLA
jgi:uncharacterized protein (TIGR02996 family)